MFFSQMKCVSDESKQSEDGDGLKKKEKTLQTSKFYYSARIITLKCSNNKVLPAPKAKGWHSPLKIIFAELNCHQRSLPRSYCRVEEYGPKLQFFKDLQIKNQFNQIHGIFQKSPEKELPTARKSPFISENIMNISCQMIARLN